MPLSSQSVQNVKAILDGVTSEGKSGTPGLVFVAVDKSGKTLIEHASGTKSIDSKDPVDMDTTFWIASMTKIVTTIALLQLVEQGKLALDDPEQIKKYAPEIGKKKVFADGVTPAEQQNPVTLRMLLAHTAGFAYAFWDPRVNMRGRPIGIDEFAGDVQDLYDSPMVNQPGSMWEYGVRLSTFPQSTFPFSSRLFRSTSIGQASSSSAPQALNSTTTLRNTFLSPSVSLA